MNLGTEYFDELKAAEFTRWLRKVVGRDDRFKHLMVPEFEEEREGFYRYFEKGLSPWQALQKEYHEYG